MTDVTAPLDEFEDYLDSIAVPDPIRERARALLEAYAKIVDIGNADMFLSDQIDGDGNRSFPSIWVFTTSFAMEAQISAEEGDQLDGTPLPGSITHWVARASDFRFDDFSETSRLSVEVWFSDQLVGDMRATGANCGRLTEIMRKYVIPNGGRYAGGQEHR